MKPLNFKSILSASDNARSRKSRFILPIVITLAVTLGGLYLPFAWNRYQHMAKAEALQLAQSVGALLQAAHRSDLSGGSPAISDNAPVESALQHLVEATNLIYYAYILRMRDGNIVVEADSAAAESPNSHPTRRSCEETVEINRLPFETGEGVLTNPIATPCGNWIRAIVPICDAEHQNVVAALGLSYSASQWRANIWKRMAPDIIIIISLLFLGVTLIDLRRKHALLKEKSESLAFQEALYRKVFEQAPIGIALVNRNKGSVYAGFSSVNPMGKLILDRSGEELADLPWTELTHPEDLEAEIGEFERFIGGEIDAYSIEKRLLRPDGSIVWTHVRIADFSDGSLNNSMYICLLEDISGRKKAEEALRESERSKSVLLSHLPGMAYRCKFDRSWTLEFASEGCYALTGYNSDSLLYNRELSYNDLILYEYRDVLWDEWKRILPQRKSFRGEYELVTKTGARKWVLELGQGIYDANGDVEALEGIVLDISEQKKKEHQITYLREHDFLTGLYNRSHLEQEKKRLDHPEYWPLSIAVCDIDGLRVINDAYGHAEGDRLICETAKLIQSCCRKGDVLVRASGGEFILLLPRTDSEQVYQVKLGIKGAVKSYNRAKKSTLYKINLSIGYGTKESEDQSMEETARSAEEFLKRRKLLNQNSSHSAIVSSIMATLYAKSQETEAHGQRLGQFCRMIGERLGLEQKDLDDLLLLSKLHDIGKIGIDDRILNKPGKLTEEEWKEMRQHPEIGYRIAIATPQLEHIAGYILHHHERWDGMGYPAGLKGEEIPLVSRILAVADAYDAMTKDRIYRRAMSQEDALREIERNAGTQFDPDITRIFLDNTVRQGEYCVLS